jgi:Ca2+-binding RTX toxin-like protein
MTTITGKYGVGSSETLAGTAADDLFDSKGGDDRIDGGAGTDTAVFFDSKSNFTITTLLRNHAHYCPTGGRFSVLRSVLLSRRRGTD